MTDGAKVCFACGVIKPATDYYTIREKGNERLTARCKTCHNAQIIARRKVNPEQERERREKRQKAERERRRLRQRQYRQKPGYIERQRANERRRKVEVPEKFAARATLQRAVRKGRIERPSGCEKCGGGSPQAHHPDYSKPLDVEWLCPSCHGLLHWGRAALSSPVQEG